MGRALTRKTVRKAAGRLARRDPDLACLLRTQGPPPLWSRRPGYPTLVRIILEQQVSLASARAVYCRVREHLGVVSPERLVETGETGLRAMGLTRQKASYCVSAAKAILEGRIDLRALARADDADVRTALTRLRGIGPWSADIYLLMALRRPDIWPAGDLALVESVRRVKRLRGPAGSDRIATLARMWTPYRAVAARMLWQSYLAERAAGRLTPEERTTH